VVLSRVANNIVAAAANAQLATKTADQTIRPEQAALFINALPLEHARKRKWRERQDVPERGGAPRNAMAIDRQRHERLRAAHSSPPASLSAPPIRAARRDFVTDDVRLFQAINGASGPSSSLAGRIRAAC
jgi:hypothetical protein